VECNDWGKAVDKKNELSIELDGRCGKHTITGKGKN
jgi:hypothetical protein